MTYLLSILPIYQNVLAWAFYEPGSLPVSILHTYALKSTQPTKVGIIILALGPTTELLTSGSIQFVSLPSLPFSRLTTVVYPLESCWF